MHKILLLAGSSNSGKTSSVLELLDKYNHKREMIGEVQTYLIEDLNLRIWGQYDKDAIDEDVGLSRGTGDYYGHYFDVMFFSHLRKAEPNETHLTETFGQPQGDSGKKYLVLNEKYDMKVLYINRETDDTRKKEQSAKNKEFINEHLNATYFDSYKELVDSIPKLL